MAVIEGNKLILYADGKPIGVTTDAVITDNSHEAPTICEAVPEFNITVEGLYNFTLTRPQALFQEWIRSSSLPRKKKKAYRKRISKAMYYEIHREQVMNYLDSI